VSQHLSFNDTGKVRRGTVAKVANRIREIRLSGMKTGARENVAHGGNVNPPRNRKGGAGNPPPTGARVPNLSRRSRRFLVEDPGESREIKLVARWGAPTAVGSKPKGRRPGTAERRQRSDAGWAAGSRSLQYDR